MATLEKRLDALEQAAKLLAAQPKPHVSSLSIEDFQKKLQEILTRELPERTQEEVIADFKASLLRMQANWEHRYGSV